MKTNYLTHYYGDFNNTIKLKHQRIKCDVYAICTKKHQNSAALYNSINLFKLCQQSILCTNDSFHTINFGARNAQCWLSEKMTAMQCNQAEISSLMRSIFNIWVQLILLLLLTEHYFNFISRFQRQTNKMEMLKNGNAGTTATGLFPSFHAFIACIPSFHIVKFIKYEIK